VRNLGKPGLAATAISAVDIALWDLAARLHGVPLCQAVGAVHDGTPVYGSGGFTSYDDATLTEQLAGWASSGIPRVKMKVGALNSTCASTIGVDHSPGVVVDPIGCHW
jgi:L-alanine-DL-glutamate epimerase-like enolase superfamily enzyme